MNPEPGVLNAERDTMKRKKKVALVLGAIKGIGKGIGLALAKEGINVALTYYDWEEHLPELQQDDRAGPVSHCVQRHS